MVEAKAPRNSWFHLDTNEYIVFDPNRVAIRYLVRFK